MTPIKTLSDTDKMELKNLSFKVWDKEEKVEKFVVMIEWNMDNPTEIIEIHTWPVAVYKGGYRYEQEKSIFKRNISRLEFINSELQKAADSARVKVVEELTKDVTRVEVITDTKGREYVNWDRKNKVRLSSQDDGRTLKIFITKNSLTDTNTKEEK